MPRVENLLQTFFISYSTWNINTTVTQFMGVFWIWWESWIKFDQWIIASYGTSIFKNGKAQIKLNKNLLSVTLSNDYVHWKIKKMFRIWVIKKFFQIQFSYIFQNLSNANCYAALAFLSFIVLNEKNISLNDTWQYFK